MCTQEQLSQIMGRLTRDLRALFGSATSEVILFGSYARHDANEDSDIDVMVLLDMPREQLPQYRKKVAEIAGGLLYDYNVMVSPLLESKAFFQRNRQTYPFFRNVDREGIRYAA